MKESIRKIMNKLTSGTLPEKLSRDEVKELEQELGQQWFFHLGYSEKLYKKPEFE